MGRLDKLRKVIKEAFSFFDKVGNNTVFQGEVGTIMRYLGQFPEEDQVVDVILRDMEDDDPSSTTVAYEAFEKLMLRCLMEHSYDPDDSETLLAAFRVLDPDGRLDRCKPNARLPSVRHRRLPREGARRVPRVREGPRVGRLHAHLLRGLRRKVVEVCRGTYREPLPGRPQVSASLANVGRRRPRILIGVANGFDKELAVGI